MVLSPLASSWGASAVTCVVCGRPEKVKFGEGADIFEYRNFVPACTETHGYHPRHRPDDIDGAKRQIRRIEDHSKYE